MVKVELNQIVADPTSHDVAAGVHVHLYGMAVVVSVTEPAM